MGAHSFQPHVGIYKDGSAAAEEAGIDVHLLQVGVGWNGALEYLPLCVDRYPSAGVVDDHVGTYAAVVPERTSYLRGNRYVRVCASLINGSEGFARPAVSIGYELLYEYHTDLRPLVVEVQYDRSESFRGSKRFPPCG